MVYMRLLAVGYSVKVIMSELRSDTGMIQVSTTEISH